MRKAGRLAASLLVCTSLLMQGCTGSGKDFDGTVAAIVFLTTALDAGGAGQLYNFIIEFGSEGGAPMPDTFVVQEGFLPDGVLLIPDREDNDLDGLPDPDGALTGNARLLGIPTEQGSNRLTIRAISTSVSPALSVTAEFTIDIGQGSIAIITPSAAQGTIDPRNPASPEVVDFVNPDNPTAFTAVSYRVAGGSGDNLLDIFIARELELSVFDRVNDAPVPLFEDTDESVDGGSGGLFEIDFLDGGLFVQPGDFAVQIGGFQSPRGPAGRVGNVANPFSGFTPPVGDPIPGLRTDWFQPDAVPTVADPTTIPGRTILFSVYTDPGYRDTDPSAGAGQAKYPFRMDQYHAVFGLPFNPGDLTPLRYNLVVQAIDRNFTLSKFDDTIARRSYVFQVRIPDIVIDTVVLPDGQAGVEYAVFVNASGGVPPLFYDLEAVDSTPDLDITADPLTQDLFGLDMREDNGGFIGIPRAASTPGSFIELTVRVFADVMNPIQSGGEDGTAAVPTGTAGEFDGAGPGGLGRHKTFQIQFAPPTAPGAGFQIDTAGLPPGVDGGNYAGIRLTASGGVPVPVPAVIGGPRPYPLAGILLTHEFSGEYDQDASFGGGAQNDVPGLPNNLEIFNDVTSANNGRITGVAQDRGFHPVTIQATDFYLGEIGPGAPVSEAANRQMVERDFTLSIGPDDILYARGSDDGDPSGLKNREDDDFDPVEERRMVPMWGSFGLFSLLTDGSLPDQVGSLPDEFDFLPVGIPHGGQDENVYNGKPSVGGFYIPEAGNEAQNLATATTSNEQAFRSRQHLLNWINLPSRRRMFLWGETNIRVFQEGNAGKMEGLVQYQELDENGDRGILMVDHVAGDFWTVATLDNDENDDDGSQFGAEAVAFTGPRNTVGVMGHRGTQTTGTAASRMDRHKLVQGLDAALQAPGTSSSPFIGSAWVLRPSGRSGVSIAVSDDGMYAATTLPGASGPNILLWRTDKGSLEDLVNGQPFIDGLTGEDRNGAPLPNSAVIIKLGGVDAGDETIDAGNIGMQNLLPDSLKFVEGGLIFLMWDQLDTIFGISLDDGTVSDIQIPDSPDVRRGIFVPDQDIFAGEIIPGSGPAQFVWASAGTPRGGDGVATEYGPTTLGFVAGTITQQNRESDLSGDRPRSGFGIRSDGGTASSERDLFALVIDEDSGEDGLDLDNATIRNLTETDSGVNGDLLTPGRLGEHRYLAVSEDGQTFAVVRDHFQDFEGTNWGSPSYATVTTGTNFGRSNDDLLIVRLNDSDDFESGGSDQNLLFLGTKTLVEGGARAGGIPGFGVSENTFNGESRRLFNPLFGKDNRSLLINYQSHATTVTKFNQFHDPPDAFESTFGAGGQMGARIQFADSDDDILDVDDINDEAANLLDDVSGLGTIGPTGAPFGSIWTNAANQLLGNRAQQTWNTMFLSDNGNFMYAVVDGLFDGNANALVGWNITGSAINGRDPYEGFRVTEDSVSLEQIDSPALGYESRFCSVPGGLRNGVSGRDAAGIVCFIAGDPSASSTTETDLEVWAFDANIGGRAVSLSDDVTAPFVNNAINWLYMSADGDKVAFHRCNATTSRDNRSLLTSNTTLGVCVNVHGALAGDTARSIVLSGEAEPGDGNEMSHGHSVAFIGEDAPSGPTALAYSAGPTDGGNDSWETRQLQVKTFGVGSLPNTVDTKESFYEILLATRNTADNENGND